MMTLVVIFKQQGLRYCKGGIIISLLQKYELKSLNKKEDRLHEKF